MTHNNCLQISVLLQIIFCSCVVETTLLYENEGSVPRTVRTDFTSLVDQKNSENTKKAAKPFTVSTI